MKYKNYVAIQNEKDGKAEWLYITKIDNKTKTWKAETNTKAKEFTITAAKDLIYGLTANYIVARIEIFPNFYEIKNN